MNAFNSSIALMYHGISDNASESQDPYYTLSVHSFGQQLEAVRDAIGYASSMRDWLAASEEAPSVMLTFDDGKASDYDIAFPLLRQFGMSADFFVNPHSVGTAGYVTWDMLREMAKAGMSIQSHGYTHDYMTTLKPDRLRENLHASRTEIEARVGHPVTLLAPPGGRIPRNLHAIAIETGYTHVTSSIPGYARKICVPIYIPRIAVTASTGLNEFESWLEGNRLRITLSRLRYQALDAAKKMMGNTMYESLRGRMIAGRT